MKVNTYTRVILNSIIAFFFSPKLIHTVSSLSMVDDRIDHPRTAHEKHPVEVILGDSQDLMGQQQHIGARNKSVPGKLRIPGRTRARYPPAEDELPKYTSLPDVSATCSSTGLVIRVKRVFYGFSAAPEELTLGNTCKSNGVREPQNDLLFTYALTDCQSEQQVLPEYIVYKFVLHYVPLSERHSFRSHRVNVGVECRFKRHHHVHSLVRPTWWKPLRKVVRSRLGDFRIQLMDGEHLLVGHRPTSCNHDSWFSPVRSAVFLLGQKVNVQVSTQHYYPGVKLFINSCYVTTANNLNQATKYGIIDNYGCLRESQINPESSYRFSRADNIVQFSFGAFQFIEAPDAQVSLHCELSVSGGGPSSVQKSCFYSHIENRWISLFGQDSVCGCCDSVCNQTKTKRLISEGFISSDQVVFTDAVTSPFSTFASSTLDSTRLAHDDDDDDDAIWFEAKLAKEPQRSQDFIASVTLRSSEGHAKRQNKSHTSTVVREEIRKVVEIDKLEDVEILMATSRSFVRPERPKVNTKLESKETRQELDSMEHVASLGWSEHKMMQSLVKGQQYWTKGVLGNTSVQEPQDVIFPSFIAEEESNSKNGEKFQDLLSYSESEEKSGFPVGLDELMEQGVVRKLALTKDPEYYFIPEGK